MIVRPSRPFHSQSRLLNRRPRAALVAASVASVLLGMSASFDAFAQASDAAGASAPVAASEAAGAVTQYSVKPGQSLGDIATQITGSTDRATREKMARAIFDANPNAFMGHDPSRLKLGSVLNVPSLEDAGVAVGASASASGASSAAVQASSAETAAAPVVAASNAVGAATVPGASVVVAPNTASEVNAAAPASEAQPTASASESASASAPLPAASSAPADVAPSTTTSVPASGNGPIGWLIGVVVAIGLLLFAMRAAKRCRAGAVAAGDDRETPETPVVSTAPEATGPILHHGATSHPHSHPATGAADLDGASVQRDQSELNVVAASMENYDAAQSFDTPTADAPVPPAEHVSIDDDGAAGTPVALDESRELEHREQQAVNPPRDADAKRAPFMPEAPAARHPDFTPPRPGAIEVALAAERAATERAATLRAEMEAREQEVRDAAALEQATREAAVREAAAREAEAKEAAARETAAREAEAREAEARETAAREVEAREAEVREVEAREIAAREAEAREASAREAEAREVEARETAARETEAREAEARETAAREAASHEASEQQPTPAQPSATEAAPHAAPNDPSAYDDEPSPASRFPQPKFPQEAIEALSALEFGLPPRQEVPPAPTAPIEAQPAPAADHAPPQHVDGNHETRPDDTAPIAPAPVTPQPIADPAVFDRQNEQHRHPESTSTSASEQIESGTAGAASVAGLGASRFGPLSLDFDYNSPASQSEPLPAFTPEQISTIARNKLELAVEYIELGDLSGARTLLQEVIESNDQATRQPAAALLSTLAPLS